MPNWTFNNLNIDLRKKDANRIEEIKDSLQGEEEDQYIDFDKVIPMPKSLELTSGTIQDLAVKAAKGEKVDVEFPHQISCKQCDGKDAYVNNMKELIRLGNKYLDNEKKYGAQTWYDWRWDNWGTKWNACDVQKPLETESDITYNFETAWSEPEPVIRQISKDNPDTLVTNTAEYEDDYFTKEYSTKFQEGYIIGESWEFSDPEEYIEYMKEHPEVKEEDMIKLPSKS